VLIAIRVCGIDVGVVVVFVVVAIKYASAHRPVHVTFGYFAAPTTPRATRDRCRTSTAVSSAKNRSLENPKTSNRFSRYNGVSTSKRWRVCVCVKVENTRARVVVSRPCGPVRVGGYYFARVEC